MTKVLVNGAAGFVGQSLLPFLIRSGYRDLVLVDVRPIPDDVLLLAEDNQIRLNCLMADKLLPLHLDSDISTVISLAGWTNVDTALAEPKMAFTSNIDIAIDLGEYLLRRNPSAKLVYLSSDEVLGESFVALSEDAPLRPTQPYAASKAAAEIILHNYRDVYDLNVITLRSCNLVGGRQRARKLIPVAVMCLYHSSPIPIFGSNTTTRQWMAVDDLCEAIVLLTCATARPGVFQASSGVHLSVEEVISIVATAIDREVQTRAAPDRLVHDRSYAMQTQRLAALGWASRIDPRVAIVRAAQELASPRSLEELRAIDRGH